MKKGNYYAVFTGDYYFYVMTYSEFINIVFQELTFELEENLQKIKKFNVLCQITIDNAFFHNKYVTHIGNDNIELSTPINPFFCWKKVGKNKYCVLVNVENGDEKIIKCSECKNCETLGSWSYEALIRRVQKELEL